jgi:DNA-binding NtrC family response regulator/TolB-like protein
MPPLSDLVGQSAGFRRVTATLERLLSRLKPGGRLPPVLLLGETGTGKTVLARAMHASSSRSEAPFVAVNCAAIPETLLEAELFGYERGAFTDARVSRDGLFQAAHRGTLFLDEIGALPLSLQAKLLTAIEDRAVRRLGSTRVTALDIWLLAATSADLAANIETGSFRRDLYHRLSALAIELPPLRDRGDDIVLLAEHFLDRACSDYATPPKRLAPNARSFLLSYGWPGNVRELANVAERIALLVDDDTVGVAALAPLFAGVAPVEPAADEGRPQGSLRDAIDAHERTRLLTAMAAADGKIARAAKLLQLPRNTLRYRLARHGFLKGDHASTSPTGDLSSEPFAAAPSASASQRVAPDGTLPALLWTSMSPDPAADPQAAMSAPFSAILETLDSFGACVSCLAHSGIVASVPSSSEASSAGLAVSVAMALKRTARQLSEVSRVTYSARSAIHVPTTKSERPTEPSAHGNAFPSALAQLLGIVPSIPAGEIFTTPSARAHLAPTSTFHAAPTADASSRGLTDHDQSASTSPPTVILSRASVAVLPFVETSSEGNYVGEALTEGVIVGLGRFRWLFVASRHATRPASEHSDPLQRVREIGIRYLVSGSVRRYGSDLRVFAELADVHSSIVLWSQAYAGTSADLLEFQDHITASIVASLEANLRSAEGVRAWRKRPRSLDAYDYVLRALSKIFLLTDRELAAAGELLHRAVQLDPSYAHAHAWLALWYIIRFGQGSKGAAEIASARYFAKHALHLDPEDFLGLAVCAHLAAFLDHNLDEAQNLFDSSLRQNPNSAFTWGHSSLTLCYLGEYTAGLSRARYALSLSPHDPLIYYYSHAGALAELLLGNFSHAIDLALESHVTNPRFSATPRVLAAAFALLGREADAQRAARDLLTLEPHFRVSDFERSYPLRDRPALNRYAEALVMAGLPR